MADSAIKYVGVDGCPAGWIGVGLDDGDGSQVEVCKDFSVLLGLFKDARLILVDMPIGLHEDGKPKLRDCDRDARWLLGERWGSVFPVPSRQFVDEVRRNPEWNHKKANKWSKECLGGGISVQSFAITRKIGDVDRVLSSDESLSSKVREAHPEVCFMALSEENKPMSYKKRQGRGFEERLSTLRRHIRKAVYDCIRKKVRYRKCKAKDVGRDDILDALALAITAKLALENGNQLRRLPKGMAPEKVIRLPDKNPPTDSNGFPMEMVYAIPNEK